MALHSPRPFLVTLGSLAALVGVAGACGKGILTSKEATVLVQKPVPKSNDADVTGAETLATQRSDASGGTTGEPKVAVTQSAVQSDPSAPPDTNQNQTDTATPAITATAVATGAATATAVAMATPATTATATPVATVVSGMIPVFLAMGHYGRTLMSCDAGQSWVADKSDGDSARCFQNDLDCDHGQGSGRGVAASPEGDVYVSFGWGSPSKIKRSSDGVNWTNITPSNFSTTFANLGFAGGRLLGGSSPVQYTDDKGATWKSGANANLDVGNYRETYSIPHGANGRVFLFGDTHNGPNAGVYSSDKGATWQAMTKPQLCTHGQLAYGNGVAVLFGGNGGRQCRSTDGGATWTLLPVIAPYLETVVFGDGKFFGYVGGDVWESATGQTWTKKARVGGGDLALVAYSPSLKAYVGFQQGWDSWYDKQKAYRSTDGITWTALAAGKFKGGHPINYVISAFVNKSTTCPGN